MRSNVFINKICQIFEFNLTNNKSKKGLLWNIILFLCFFFLFSFGILNSFWNDVIGLNAVICWTRLLVRLGHQASLDLI